MIAYPITDAALRWLEVILAERFGQAWQLSRTVEGLRLQLVGAEGAILFDTLCEGFTQAHSDQPFTRWDAEREGWASVLGGPLPASGVAELPSPLIEPRGAAQVIHYDILGLTYWMLARVEEIGRTDLDNHARFQATASHAFKHGYLDRPVVDEWLHILKQVIQKQWPNQKLKVHKYEVVMTCDVDNPLLYNDTLKDFIKKLIGDIIKRKSPLQAFSRICVQVLNKLGNISYDPYFKGIRNIMRICESKNLSCNFYFIPDKNEDDKGIPYKLESKNLKKILKEIINQGHEVSLHPSYSSYINEDSMRQNKIKFIKILESIGCKKHKIHSRQHYLRWKNPDSLEILDSLSISTDSSLYFAEKIGFRCGTCREFKMFNPVSQNPSKVTQIPLTFMDTTFFSSVYQSKKTKTDSINDIYMLAKLCFKFKGKFVILWHNCTLSNMKFMEDIIDSTQNK